MKNIAERLKFARAKKGWTQNQLAVAAGVSQGTIGNIESEVRQAKGSLPQIAEALGINHKWLYKGEGPMEAHQVTINGSFPPLTGSMSVLASNQAPALMGRAGEDANKVATDAEIVEMISDKLGALTDDQRKDMSAKLAALALAPDSPTLKKSISESLGSAPSVAVVGNTKTPDFLKR